MGHELDTKQSISGDTSLSLALMQEGMHQLNVGVSIYDADFFLVAANKRFQEIFAFPNEMVQRGAPLVPALHLLAKNGEYGPITDIDEFAIGVIESLRKMEAPMAFERCRMDGRYYESKTSRLESGGYITIHTDITNRKQREAELKQANAELSTALNNLKQAQNQILRTEKLAALGSLVAGVAHELNTPIGNTLTVSSTLHDQADNMNLALNVGLKRSTLENFFNQIREASDIMMRNLSRAAELISSFKQVAVDQTSSQRRPFKLKEVISETIITLRPTLKQTPYVIDYDIPESILMDSFPGPLGRVVANLINNSIIHGFDGRPEGTINIEARQLDEHQTELKMRDDGKGIPQANISRIFDPFFTTKLGHGGSGMGLSIVFTIVTGVLGGNISVDSELEQGTTLTLTLPNNAPEVVVIETEG